MLYSGCLIILWVPFHILFPLFLPKDLVYLSSRSLCAFFSEEKRACNGSECVCLFSLYVHAFLQLLPHAHIYICIYVQIAGCSKIRSISLAKVTSTHYSAEPWHTGHIYSDGKCDWLQLTAQDWCPRSWIWQSLSPLSPSSPCSHVAILAHQLE